MNRTAICAVLIALIAAASVGSLLIIDRSTDKLFALIDEVIDAGEHGTANEVEKAVAELEDHWARHYLRLSCLVQTGPLNDISYAVAKLRPLYAHSADDFIAECRGIRYWASLISESQQPNLHSIM